MITTTATATINNLPTVTINLTTITATTTIIITTIITTTLSGLYIFVQSHQTRRLSLLKSVQVCEYHTAVGQRAQSRPEA